MTMTGSNSQTIVSTSVKALEPDQSVHKALLEEGTAAALTPFVIEVYHIILYNIYWISTEYMYHWMVFPVAS
jgi:hypothetical protein